MAWFLKFIVTWLRILGVEISNDFLAKIVTIFPGSLYSMRQFMDLDRDNFNKFVVCPKCTKLYRYDSCLTVVNNRQVAKTCTHFHYSRGKKKTCNSALVTKVLLKNRKVCFYPIKYYCCNSIASELEKFVLRDNFTENCEAWRSRNVSDGILADVFDGTLWKDFQTINGKDFLKSPRNYGFMLNFDFFQPMKHRKDYSVGVFYLALLNLPRAQRFKWENIIVLGIVPSLDREPKNLNEFLQPAVTELQALWKGVRLKSCLSRFPLTFRAAVMCTSSDIPATRKLCGFKSHSAVLGCSRCMKEFPGNFGEKRNYSGFDRAAWKPRTNNEHRSMARKMNKCKTVGERTRLGKKAGIAHYSVLIELEYIDIIRFATIDPMHNLFLGTAKKIFQMWVERKVLSSKMLTEIESKIGSFEVPSDIGRLPKKITCNSGSYTAEQWKNWTLIYSVYCLSGILPNEHFKCWQTFVLACKYLCNQIIYKTQLEIADRLLIKFCKTVETLYGEDAITPNMHMHGHLKEVILDHGPITGFWCFSFERFNGILGSTTTNNRSVELQLMRRFIVSRYIGQVNISKDFKDDFVTLCTPIITDKSEYEMPTNTDWGKMFQFQKISSTYPLNNIDWMNTCGIRLPSFHRISHFDTDDLQLLMEVYRVMFPDSHIDSENLGENIHKYGSITIGPVRYGSRLEPRGIRSSNILASWPNGDGNIIKETFNLSAGTVSFYFSHSLKLGAKYHMYYFACVRWYMSDEQCDSIGNPVKVWKASFQQGGSSSFIPVQRIYSRFGFTELKEHGETKIVVSPIGRKIYL
jgi:hypothetical protein